MALDFSGKAFLITGAASGMGLATSMQLLSRGARVALCDINESGLDNAISSIPSPAKERSLAITLDVTSRSAVHAALQNTLSTFSRLDGVVNYAGTGGTKLGAEILWETTDKEYDFIIDLNVRGTFHILAESLKPGLLSSGASIVHVGSMYSMIGFEKGAVFAASKHAALGMVRSAAKEMRDRVRVNCVLPGPIDTPMHRMYSGNRLRPDDKHSHGTLIPRPGTADEVANVVLFLLSDASSYVTGAAWSVDGGANA